MEVKRWLKWLPASKPRSIQAQCFIFNVLHIPIHLVYFKQSNKAAMKCCFTVWANKAHILLFFLYFFLFLWKTMLCHRGFEISFETLKKCGLAEMNESFIFTERDRVNDRYRNRDVDWETRMYGDGSLEISPSAVSPPWATNNPRGRLGLISKLDGGLRWFHLTEWRSDLNFECESASSSFNFAPNEIGFSMCDILLQPSGLARAPHPLTLWDLKATDAPVALGGRRKRTRAGWGPSTRHRIQKLKRKYNSVHLLYKIPRSKDQKIT